MAILLKTGNNRAPAPAVRPPGASVFSVRGTSGPPDGTTTVSAWRPRFPALQRSLKALATFVALMQSLAAVTLDDLRREPPPMTPPRFAAFFTDFTYQYFEEIQPVEVFLATRNGDCDDYATLAAMILAEKGLHPRLFAIRMPGLVHVVCYVGETQTYLDYNNRVYLKKTAPADGSLKDIARRVAKSFDASWTSCSEFTYTNGVKHMVSTIVKTGGGIVPSAPLPQANPPANAPSRIIIDF